MESVIGVRSAPLCPWISSAKVEGRAGLLNEHFPTSLKRRLNVVFFRGSKFSKTVGRYRFHFRAFYLYSASSCRQPLFRLFRVLLLLEEISWKRERNLISSSFFVEFFGVCTLWNSETPKSQKSKCELLVYNIGNIDREFAISLLRLFWNLKTPKGQNCKFQRLLSNVYNIGNIVRSRFLYFVWKLPFFEIKRNRILSFKNYSAAEWKYSKIL